MKPIPLLLTAALFLALPCIPGAQIKTGTLPTDTQLRFKARYYRTFAPVGAVEEEIRLDLKKTAFLLIDVYGKDFDKVPAAGTARPAVKTAADLNRDIIVNHIVPARAAARKVGMPIVYLCNYLAPQTTENTEFRNLSIRTYGGDILKLWKEPTEAFAYSRIIAPDKGDYQVLKQMYSGFFETNLDSLLKSLGVKNLVVVGFDFRICLGATVTDAMYHDYRVVVLRDCGRTSEFPETEEGKWANFLAVRFIEKNAGYTALSEDFIKGLQGISLQR